MIKLAKERQMVSENDILSFVCPHCGKTLRSKVQYAGRKLECPGCKSIVYAPAARKAAPQLVEAPPVCEPSLTITPKLVTKVRRTRHWQKLAVVALAVVVVLMTGGIVASSFFAAFDPNDLKRTQGWSHQFLASLPTSNKIACEEQKAAFESECQSLVGQKVAWRMPVRGVSSGYVILVGISPSLTVEFVDKDGLSRLERLDQDLRDVRRRSSGDDFTALTHTEMSRLIGSQIGRPMSMETENRLRVLRQKFDEAREELESDRWEVIHSFSAADTVLKIGMQVSLEEAKLLTAGNALDIGGVLHRVQVVRSRVLISLRDVRSLKGDLEYRPPAKTEKPQPLSLEDCQRIVRAYVKKEPLVHNADVKEDKWLEPCIVAVDYGLHLLKPDLPAGSLATIVRLRNDVSPHGSRTGRIDRKIFWIKGERVVHIDEDEDSW